MFNIFFESLKEDYNVIDIISCKRFIGLKDRVYYALNVRWRFFVVYNDYVRSLKITMVDDYEFFSVLFGHTLLIEEVGAVYSVNIFTV